MITQSADPSERKRNIERSHVRNPCGVTERVYLAFLTPEEAEAAKAKAA